MHVHDPPPSPPARSGAEFSVSLARFFTAERTREPRRKIERKVPADIQLASRIKKVGAVGSCSGPIDTANFRHGAKSFNFAAKFLQN